MTRSMENVITLRETTPATVEQVLLEMVLSAQILMSVNQTPMTVMINQCATTQWEVILAYAKMATQTLMDHVPVSALGITTKLW